MNCPVCGTPMHHFMQSASFAGKPDIEQVECHGDCDYRYVTLSPDQHLGMTPEKRAGYLKVGKAQRARIALMKAQEDRELEAAFVAHGLNRQTFWGDPAEAHR